MSSSLVRRSLALGFAVLTHVSIAGPALRPPSVPLICGDPYFSIWSPADKLTDSPTVHWTGKPHRLTAYAVIDGKEFRIMGTQPAAFPPLTQTGLEVSPTRTVYIFEDQGLRLQLTFMTPALPDDLMIYSRPVTYLTFESQSVDGKNHELEVRLIINAELAVNTPDQTVLCTVTNQNHLRVVSIGSTEQPVLAKKGDDLRIDWGRFYLAIPEANGSAGIVQTGAPPSAVTSSECVETRGRAAECKIAAVPGLGTIGRRAVSSWLMLAYDDEFSIQYFKTNLRPYWRRNGDDAAMLLKKAAAEYASLKRRCEKFDTELMADLARAGGPEYAKICALAYRQCYAANKVVADARGQPLMFPKENFSNGCIGTVDVIYPMAPQFLLFCPSLVKAMLVPILDYAASSRWRWPFAPHDLGTYPLANGQVYGGGERTETDQMPVEETGNMLILLAALARIEGNADFCAPYWPVLQKWTEYLRAKGFDPENQLCTDDFAGHLAHNVNLSAKAICALGAFATLCQARGDKARSGELMSQARQFAARWTNEAGDGGHFRLAFDKPGTWSQKYNLVWDRILELNLFPDDVRTKEMAYYKTVQNAYGLPLDNRKPYTKLDWTLWTATLTQNRADFNALVSPMFRFLNETPSRVPMTDWFMTTDAKQTGFQARSVVGGVFLQMLYDRQAWKKWASRDKARCRDWAPLPQPPRVRMILPAADTSAATWRYTTNQPAADWNSPAFDDAAWNQGPSGFGSPGTPGAIIGTTWTSSDIWLRREFTLSASQVSHLQCWLHHDEDAEVYLNGLPAVKTTGWTTEYDSVPLNKEARASLHPGRNSLAVHCHQTSGGQYIDVGLAEIPP